MDVSSVSCDDLSQPEDSNNTDRRGVKRGRCSQCGCSQFVASGDSLGKMSCCRQTCGHPPGKHHNLSISPVCGTDGDGDTSLMVKIPVASVSAMDSDQMHGSSTVSLITLPSASRPSGSQVQMLERKTPSCRKQKELGKRSPRPHSPLRPIRPSSAAHAAPTATKENASPSKLVSSSMSRLNLDTSSRRLLDLGGPYLFTQCAFPGCSSPAPFDPNTGVSLQQSPFCDFHKDAGPSAAGPGDWFLQPPVLGGAASSSFHVQQSPASAASFADVPQDLQCDLPGCSKKKYIELSSGVMYDYCGRRHARQHKRMQHEGTSVLPEMQCKTPGCPRPKHPTDDNTGYFDFCSRDCRDSYQQGQRAPPSFSGSVPVPLQKDSTMCVLPNCYQVKYTDASGFTHECCNKSHAQLAQQQGISIEITTLTELKAGSPEYTRVESDFRKNWARGKGHCPNIDHIFSVKNTKLEMRWKQYQQKLTSSGSPSNTEEHYHGTSIACDLANMKAMCSDGQCGVCGVSKLGFEKKFIQHNIKFVRFGKGFYVAPNSSKCHDYTQGRHTHRAMLLCDVVPGNKYVLIKTNEKLPGPPQGYDSVHGQAGHSLNYEELVLYHEESILPKYVIMYQKDGVHKIAK